MYNENLLRRLNQYVIDMQAINVKLHNFHWNIVGPFFGEVHAFTQAYYEKADLMYDQVAERIKMLNKYPETLLTVYSQQTKIQELESKDFQASEIIDHIIRDFEYLLDSSRRIVSLANSINDDSTVAMFTDYIQFFEKELWILKSKMK
ncbi:DNA starvation/stationary phase protection protein [Mycoplasmatota bacterium WC44]